MKNKKEKIEIKNDNKLEKATKKNKIKIKISDIFLYSAILLTFAFLIFTIVDLFTSVANKELTPFTQNFLFSFGLIIIATTTYFLLLYFEKLKLTYPEWFKCFIIFDVLIFTVLYPMLNLYNIIYTDILFNIVLSFILTLVGFSIFYNYLKNNKNTLKASPFMIIMFSLFFTISIGVTIEIVEFIINIIAKKDNSINNMIIDLSTIIIVSIITNLVYYISLRNEKILINNSLIFSDKK